MDLRHLTDEALDGETIRLARNEREVLTAILHHLKEVERRRLFSKYKLPSLFAYAVSRMGYSEDQAARRISAMRLLKELPGIEKKIEDGDLTLTHLVRAQIVFRQEARADVPRSSDEKLALLTQIEKTSKRDAEKTLKKEALVEVSFVPNIGHDTSLEQFSEPVRAKLKRLLDLKVRNVDGIDPLVGELADLGLEKWDPLRKAERAMKRSTNSVASSFESTLNESDPAPSSDITSLAQGFVRDTRDHIPAAIRHHVIWRDHGECRFCKSSRNLQIDHITPIALGGTNEPDNLRLVCRSCNQRTAIEVFGADKMENFLGRRSNARSRSNQSPS